MEIFQTGIKNLHVAKFKRREDSRGSFARFFCLDELKELVDSRNIVQINHSRTSQKGAIRGMHFQRPPYAEMKLVRCLKGRVWDVAVDLRRNSKTFLSYFAQELSPQNDLMMVIPEGFAHGFQVLEPNSELLYIHSAMYSPECEGGISHSDPKIGIEWPLDVTDISERDISHPLIENNFNGIAI